MPRSKWSRRWQSFCELPGIVRAGAYLALLIMLVVLFGCTADARPDATPPGDLVYTQGTFSVRLRNEPCGNDEFRLILEDEGIPPAKRSVITSGSRSYGGCWVRNIDGDVLTLDYLATETGTLPKEGFKPVPEA